ncbi:MAG: hypothetical protein B6D59_04725 [Campylobacteraceae bacterium 4484_4]|nr:MAG: hypothetical protein B6D59_04725 [Campylobacteraceae bacterium 4484_4]
MPASHKWIYASFVFVWIILAIDPKYPEDWLLENVLVFTLFPLVVWLDRKYRLSLLSLLLLLIFASLHELGAHFTYAEMKFFDPITHFFGFSRNHFDRVVHFLYGLMLFRPMFEILSRYVRSGGAALLFTFSMIVSISALYEILEWAATMVFHPDLGIAFLGIQGDVWDAQKDMLGAIIGAAINALLLKSLYMRAFEKFTASRSKE